MLIHLISTVTLPHADSNIGNAITASTEVSGWWVYLLSGLFGLAMLALTWLLAQLQRKVGADANATKAQLVAARWAHFGEVVVRDLNATLRPKFNEAVRDGKLTVDEIAQLRTEGLRRLKELGGEQGMQELRQTLHILAPSVDSYLFGVLEMAVARTKMPTTAIAVPAEVVVPPVVRSP